MDCFNAQQYYCYTVFLSTIQRGTYGFVKDSKVFFYSKANNAVMLDASGNFVTGFKLAPGTQ
jgi:filamentous hemagglutinin